MKKIINNILHRFKEDSLAKRGKTAARTVVYKPMKEIRKVLVFWVADPAQDRWLRKLSGIFAGAHIDKLCFVPEETEMPETGDVVTLRNEDLGFGGKIQNDRLTELLNKKYDLMVDLTMNSNALIDYVIRNTHAGCITGTKKTGAEADIVIQGIHEPLGFMDRMKDVLSGINVYSYE